MPDGEVFDVRIGQRGHDHLSPAQPMRMKELASLLVEKKSIRKALHDERAALRERWTSCRRKSTPLTRKSGQLFNILSLGILDQIFTYDVASIIDRCLEVYAITNLIPIIHIIDPVLLKSMHRVSQFMVVSPEMSIYSSFLIARNRPCMQSNKRDGNISTSRAAMQAVIGKKIADLMLLSLEKSNSRTEPAYFGLEYVLVVEFQTLVNEG